MRFCFHNGYRNIKGGYTTLLITLIKELVRQKEEVLLFNFENGLIAEELKKENIIIEIVDLEKLNWQKINEKILPTDVFIIVRFEEEFKHLFIINPRIIYYDINDFICNISDYKFGIKLPFLGKKLVQKLLLQNGLLFMDDTGMLNLKRSFDIEVRNPKFLPIPVAVPEENKFLKRSNFHSEVIGLTYIGRSVDWKMMPLKKILRDLSGLKFNGKIRFTIVVDNIKDLNKFIELNEYKTPMLTFNVLENISPSGIESILMEHSTLHFAMGTSALDAAKLGIPTILMDWSNKDFDENYLYNWLFNTDHFNLGRNLDTTPEIKGNSLEVILNDINTNYGINEKSQATYNYVSKNHSVKNLIPQLKNACIDTRFRIKNSRNFIPYYFKIHSLIKKMFIPNKVKKIA